jgi:integrase
MYRKVGGLWKSDFKLNGVRYQKTWDTVDYELAIKLEKEWKHYIKHPQDKPIENLLSFKGATDYLYETRWRYLRDWNNPKSRWLKISKYFGENRQIKTLTIDDLDRFKKYLVNKKYANKTVNHFISILKTSIEYLEKKQKVVFNHKLLFDGLKMSVNSKRKICFSKIEEEEMYNTFVSKYEDSRKPDDWQMIQYFIINFSLGLRPAEYLNLQLGDFDLEQRTVTISRGSYNSTKNDLIRTLPLEGIVLEAVKLQLLFSLQQLHNIDYNKENPLNEVINSSLCKKLNFTSLTKYMVINRWNKMKEYLEWTDKETYKEYIPYGIRHTVASRLASISKWNGYKIMTFMGHKSYYTSLNYVHLGVEDIRDGSCTNNQDIELLNYF